MTTVTPKNIFTTSNSEWLDIFNELLQQNLEKPMLTNAFLANNLGISERKLYRKVKALTGQTPNLYIREKRLNKAHDLLSSGKFLTVKEVVPRVGFIKVKYFYTIFKAHFGYPPGYVLRKKGFK